MKKKTLFIILGSCLFLLITAITTLAIIRSKINIYIGDKRVGIKVFESYKDPGATLRIGKKTIKPSKYKVKVTGSYDINKIGMYKIDYSVKYYGKELTDTKIVTVYDDTKPELTLNIDKVQKDYCTKKYKQEIKYTATDNYDGDISSKVEVEETEDKLIYKAVDSSGNETIKEVLIDYGTKPSNKFELNGSAKTYVNINSEYTEKGASYVDGCGKKIDKEIKITGTVDTKTLGEYKITYEVAGEKPITRTVIVREKPHKIIYLTFDDGPGANTKKVLNALDKYNVKATFFVTNQFPKYQYLIKEEYDKGHAIGVHTLTHSWNIYNSLQDYIYDFDAMNEIIKTQKLCKTFSSCLNPDEQAAISEKFLTPEIREVMSDKELIDCINAFFKNNLNISETSRNAFLHRNTLLYRIDKIHKITGLNIRNFEEAMTFKLLTIIYDKTNERLGRK